MKILSKIAFVLSLGMIAAGCATTQSQMLKTAQQSYNQAEKNSAITENASVDLYEARKLLNRAKNAEDTEEQEHFAYLAQKRIELAQTRALQAETREEAARLQEEQSDFSATIRQQQIDQARQEAQRSQQQLRAYQSEEQERSAQRAQQAEAELERLRNEMAANKTEQTKEGTVLTLSEVIFEFNKAQLKSGAERNLERLSDFLKEFPERKVVVEGFTDSIGSNPYNEQLSKERAQAVARALEADGISSDRITARGLGEAFPIATNDTPAGRQQNRRVEITILNPEGEPEKAGRGN